VAGTLSHPFMESDWSTHRTKSKGDPFSSTRDSFFSGWRKEGEGAAGAEQELKLNKKRKNIKKRQKNFPRLKEITHFFPIFLSRILPLIISNTGNNHCQ